MSDSRHTRLLLLGSAGALCLAVTIAAQAQTMASPFAKKNKRQAWETPAPSSQPQTRPNALPQPQARPTLRGSDQSRGAYIPPSQSKLKAAPRYSQSTQSQGQAARPGTYRPPATSNVNAYRPTGNARQSSAQASNGTYASSGTTQKSWNNGSQYRSSSNTGGTYKNQPSSGGQYNPPSSTNRQSSTGQYQSRNYGQPSSGSSYTQKAPQSYQSQSYGSQSYQPQSGGAYYPGRTQEAQAQQGYYQPQNRNSLQAPYPQRPQTWRDRVGLSNLAATITGFLKIGGGATERSGNWDADFVADGAIRGEVSAVTGGGLEYGAGLELRGQYDKYRRGFGGRVGDCPPTLAGCSTTMVGGTATSVRGHTSQFYSHGASDAEESEFALEGAYIFLRTAYGDITAGRDDGSAYLFSLGAPSLLAVGASNSSVDYTGLDSVKTVNDASGFSEKIVYTSPRLLGDQIGLGVQFGASYALDADACGVDYCVRPDGEDGSGTASPDLKNVAEFGMSLDRKFNNGFSIEATATYAMASEESGNTAFDDLSAFGLGAELGYNDFTLGGSYLKSNNGLNNGDYIAWDTGLTWQPSKFGVTIGYGHAEDKNVGLTSNQGVFGLSYDFNDNMRLGTGVQYIEREVPFDMGGVVTPTKEKATSVFVEGRITF